MLLLRFWRKVKSLALALWSLFWYGTVTADVREMRLSECGRCDARIKKPKANYCGACGCPQWYLSRLEVKTRMFEIKCPLDKW
jgi:hypothetical protein